MTLMRDFNGICKFARRLGGVRTWHWIFGAYEFGLFRFFVGLNCGEKMRVFW